LSYFTNTKFNITNTKLTSLQQQKQISKINYNLGKEAINNKRQMKLILVVAVLGVLVNNSLGFLIQPRVISKNINHCNQKSVKQCKCHCGLCNNMMMMSTSATNIPLVEPFGKGLKNDIKTKMPYLKSDFTDGINLNILSNLLAEAVYRHPFILDLKYNNAKIFKALKPPSARNSRNLRNNLLSKLLYFIKYV
jgi:hypothetical protein